MVGAEGENVFEEASHIGISILLGSGDHESSWCSAWLSVGAHRSVSLKPAGSCLTQEDGTLGGRHKFLLLTVM